ncbi:hypothetical protein AOXY_G9660 [Acipenser oxyrinchus oxyrinchus]|uniref:Uncharacterized protein n=1 Tax=Acipenser oxyrinchus oxyrinchus TaxID=40147 RepID=A0AAD8DHN6_ACIOX|nr:hypothetical protein AOXY_G9660 [Acipenser oxyrinchus oxyrinchus]
MRMAVFDLFPQRSASLTIFFFFMTWKIVLEKYTTSLPIICTPHRLARVKNRHCEDMPPNLLLKLNRSWCHVSV